MYCGKPGHWKRDCRKFKADKAKGRVQAVTEGQPSASSPAASASQVSTVAPSHSASQVRSGTIARIEEIDLTAFDQCDDDGLSHVRMLRGATEFFTICDDDDSVCGPWSVDDEYEVLSMPSQTLMELLATSMDAHASPLAHCPESFAEPKCSLPARLHFVMQEAPADCPEKCSLPARLHFVMQEAPADCPQESNVTGLDCASHIRAVVHGPGGQLQDIILDSGADVSALPDTYAHVGEPSPISSQGFVDALWPSCESSGHAHCRGSGWFN